VVTKGDAAEVWTGNQTLEPMINPIPDHLRNTLTIVVQRLGNLAFKRPMIAVSLLLGTGLALGAGVGIGANAALEAKVERQQAQLALTKRDAQREINALAARLGELNCRRRPTGSTRSANA
jgi:hypothetical protein